MENSPRKPYDGFIGTPAAKALGLVLAFVITFLMMYFGAYSQYCLFVFVGVLLFVIPKFFGVKSIKALAALGIVFFLVTSLVGAFLVTIPTIESGMDNKISGDFYNYNIQQTPGTDEYSVTVCYDGASAPKFNYLVINTCSFGFIFGMNKEAEMTRGTDNTYQTTVTLSASTLYLAFFSADDKSSDKIVIEETLGSDTIVKTAVTGNIYVTGIPTVMFFLILAFHFWMRRNLDKQRAKFEAEGRLYPKGYGLCKKCGMTVLPGEKVCRKCGEPIDIPKEIQMETLAKLYGTVKCPMCGNNVVKIEKVCPECGHTMPGHEELAADETFKCSECGTDVPANADRCPMCGASFDDDEPSATSFKCSDCGEIVSADTDFCPKCGAKFDKE